MDSKADDFKANGTRDDRMVPPYNTVNIGTIEGGTAGNIIAGGCQFSWGCRSILEEDTSQLVRDFQNYCDDEVLPPLRKISEDVQITTHKVHSLPPLKQNKDNPIEALMRQLTGHNQTVGVAFGTEAGLFSGAGIPAVVYGPGFIEQAHKPNEFISIKQLESCSDFILSLAKWAAK